MTTARLSEATLASSSQPMKSKISLRVHSAQHLFYRGMVTGEAFVELAGQKYLDRALERHKQSLGER